jgi:hypothetical protein
VSRVSQECMSVGMWVGMWMSVERMRISGGEREEERAR